jgi:hypothetical protein
VLDGSFTGFRASVGRTGLINHRRSDYQAATRGAGLVCVLLARDIAEVCVDLLGHPAHLEQIHARRQNHARGLRPYALLVLIALACYAALNWRLKYLASALMLGPLTLLRPVIAILGGALGLAQGNVSAAAAAVCVSVIAILAVEPLAGRLWYARNASGPAA